MKKHLIFLLTTITLLTVSCHEMFDKYSVDSEKCTDCEECIDVCPENAIKMKDGKAVIDPDDCIGCGDCAKVCQSDAISN